MSEYHIKVIMDIDQIKDKRRLYRIANKERRNSYDKQWRKDHPGYNKEYNKEWYKDHKEEINTYTII